MSVHSNTFLAAMAAAALIGEQLEEEEEPVPRMTRAFIQDKSRGYFATDFPWLYSHPEEFFKMVRMYPDLFDHLLGCAPKRDSS